MNKYELAIIGGGPAGYVTAIKAARMGKKTILFEKDDIGGVCLNVGCIPTKTLMKSAHLYSEIKDASNFGINIGDKEKIGIDWDELMNRKKDVVKKLTSGIDMLLKDAGVTVVKKFAEVIDSKHIISDSVEYEAEKIILALGSSPSIPNVDGMKEAYKNGDLIDSTKVLSLKKQPKKLLIIGGGVIALEFAIIYNSFGTEVVMIQRSDMILSNMDYDIRKTMQKIAEKSGIKIHTKTRLLEVNGKKIKFEKNGKILEESGDEVLVSLGRNANTSGIEKLNLEMERGSVKVNSTYETSVKNVFAIGDMSSKIKLAHVASAEGLCLLDNLYNEPRELDYKKVPSGIYGFPEAASVGITEEEAKEEKLDYEVGKFMISSNGRSMANGENEGFVKIISDRNIGEILGVHIVAGIATDLISEALMIMQLEGTVEEIAASIHPHPTNSEIIMETAHILEGYPIHAAKKRK